MKYVALPMKMSYNESQSLRQFQRAYAEHRYANAAPCAVLTRAMNKNLVKQRGIAEEDEVFPRGPDAEGDNRSTWTVSLVFVQS